MGKNNEKLFDMADDSYEMKSIINDPECIDVLTDMRHKGLVHCDETGNTIMKPVIKQRLELSYK
jgi:hypothetical protein